MIALADRAIGDLTVRRYLSERKFIVPVPRVIIVGGGFGGLYAARALRGAPVNEISFLTKRRRVNVSRRHPLRRPISLIQVPRRIG